MGKMAIIFAILDAEGRSVFRESMSKEKARLDWYTDLFGRLTDGLIMKQDFGRFGDNKVSFVTFNYDRSLEYLFHESLVYSFCGIASEDIRQVFQRIPIVHVYGQIAPLDWQESPDDKPKIAYRMRANLGDVPDLIDNLHVIYDERSHRDLDKARELISQAERVFFLGFGYARENLEALGLPEVLQPGQLIYGTAFERTRKEIHDIETLLTLGLEHADARPSNKAGQVRIVDCDSVSLLREFL
jgi:hypothetical protein